MSVPGAECAPGETSCDATGLRTCGEDGTWGPAALSESDATCDGVDDDCDGVLDEDVDNRCTLGACNGERRCENGEFTACITLRSPEAMGWTMIATASSTTTSTAGCAGWAFVSTR